MTPADNLHMVIMNNLFDEKTGMIYTFINPATMKPVFPSVEEVWQSIPNTAGWQTPIEDCCLCGGTSLAAMLLRHQSNPCAETEQSVRNIFRGLKTLASCGRRRGFIARGVLPDGKTHYMDTSVDQYTHFLFGIWRYFKSPLCSVEDREFIKQKVSDICLQLEEDDFYINTEAGSAATFGDIGALRYSRVERVLQVYAAGWKLTGNAHFEEIYNRLKEEQNGKRMEILATQFPPSGECLYAILQTQMALRCLYEIEPDSKSRAIFREAMSRVASAAAGHCTDYTAFGNMPLCNEEYDWRKNWNGRRTDNIWTFYRHLSESGKSRQIEHVNKTVRHSAEAIICLLLSDDSGFHAEARKHSDKMLQSMDFNNVWASDPWIHAEYAWHLARS